MRQVNQATISLITEFEGKRLTVYKDPIGLPTVGVSRKVFPSLVMLNIKNRLLDNAVIRRDFAQRPTIRPNRPYLIFGQLGITGLAVRVSFLRDAIPYIVQLCSDKQMARSYTRRIITFVKKFLCGSEKYAVLKFIRNPMRFNGASVNPYPAVSVLIRGGRPRPATTCFVNVGVQAFPQVYARAASRRIVASVTAKSSLPVFDLCSRCFEWVAALVAGTWYRWVSQGVNLHELGLALVRPVQSHQRLFGSICILT